MNQAKYFVIISKCKMIIAKHIGILEVIGE
jgi:hypothetical protein